MLVAPAMNNHMYEHAATQANLATLRERGVTVLEPGVGALGSKGEWGVGRLPEPPELLAAVEAVAPAGAPAPWTGCASSSPPAARASRSTPCASSATARSGRMGFALAEEAAALGAEVTVVAANVAPRAQPARPLRRRRDRGRAARPPARPSSPRCDVLLMAAAVADFRPAEAGRDEAQEGPQRRRSR